MVAQIQEVLQQKQKQTMMMKIKQKKIKWQEEQNEEARHLYKLLFYEILLKRTEGIVDGVSDEEKPNEYKF